MVVGVVVGVVVIVVVICAGLWRYMVVYMTVSHYSLGMVTRTWSTLYLQRQFLI